MMTRRKSTVLLGALALGWGALAVVGCGGGEKGGDNAPSGAPAADNAASAAPAAPAGASGPTGTATVAGTVTYDGPKPKSIPTINMAADPTCASKHPGGTVPTDTVELGPNNELGNVFVYVSQGLPDAQWSPPSTPVTIDQNGCLYHPHVVGVMTGQKLVFLNSDGLLHNVHALPQVNQEFNIAMPAERKEAEHQFDQAEGMFHVKCDVHPWMTAYVGVQKNPFFAVSGTDGKFSIANLPAGTYTLEAWYENGKLKADPQQVTVADGATANVNFVFKRTT